MPAVTRENLERKARYPDLGRARERLRPLRLHEAGVEVQCDTYFHVARGRLKLRTIEGRPAVLIWYDRPDGTEVRTSRYHLVPAPDPALLLAALTEALGVRGAVRKRREILLYHNVRIHLDEVAGLGTFVEFEAVLTGEVSAEASHRYLGELGRILAIAPEDLVAPSYADLLGI